MCVREGESVCVRVCVWAEPGTSARRATFAPADPDRHPQEEGASGFRLSVSTTLTDARDVGGYVAWQVLLGITRGELRFVEMTTSNQLPLGLQQRASPTALQALQ